MCTHRRPTLPAPTATRWKCPRTRVCTDGDVPRSPEMYAARAEVVRLLHGVGIPVMTVPCRKTQRRLPDPTASRFRYDARHEASERRRQADGCGCRNGRQRRRDFGDNRRGPEKVGSGAAPNCPTAPSSRTCSSGRPRRGTSTQGDSGACGRSKPFSKYYLPAVAACADISQADARRALGLSPSKMVRNVFGARWPLSHPSFSTQPLQGR